MPVRKIAPFVVIAVVFGAAAFALARREAPEATAAPSQAAADDTAAGAAREPPSEPPRRGPAGPIASQAIMGSENTEAPAIAWTVPAGWEAVRNPNGMRLASYRVREAEAGDDAVDISIARAGGSADANIQRWASQFDDGRAEQRDERSVHGLHVTLVDIRGTYRGGGMMMPGPAPSPRNGWAMLAAIVAPPTGAPYFFKVLGPAASVQSQRPAFDALIDSVAPR